MLNINSFININDKINIYSIKKRKNADNNIYELIATCYYINPNITNKEELLILLYNPHKINCLTLSKYIININAEQINTYYNYYRILSIKNTLQLNNINNIYLTGKSFTKYPEIEKLNKLYNKIQTKGDIYILYEKDIVSISIKQNKNCPESNYSIYKFISLEESNELKSIFNKVLINNNTNINDRNSVNKIFYKRNNIYFNKLNEIIITNKQYIINRLIELLFSTSIKYKIYKFNGIEFELINRIELLETEFTEYIDYYINRSCAKMFYKLVIKYIQNKTIKNKIYRIEIRWKGSFTASPQFMAYLD